MTLNLDIRPFHKKAHVLNGALNYIKFLKIAKFVHNIIYIIYAYNEVRARFHKSQNLKGILIKRLKNDNAGRCFQLYNDMRIYDDMRMFNFDFYDCIFCIFH